MSSLFKYLGQTDPVNAGVRPAKPAKREKGKVRRGERTPHDGKNSVAREGRRERKDEERELLAMEKFPFREGRRGREREREEREGREEDFPPPASSHDGSNFCREEMRGERRGKLSREREDIEREKRERGEEEEREVFSLASPRDRIFVTRERARRRERNREKKEKLRKRSSPCSSLMT